MIKELIIKKKAVFIGFLFIILIIAGFTYYLVQIAVTPDYQKKAASWHNYVGALAQDDGLLDFSKEFPFEWDYMNIHDSVNDNNYMINRDALLYLIESNQMFADTVSALTFMLDGEYVFAFTYPIGTVEYYNSDKQFINAQTFSREDAVFEAADKTIGANTTQWYQTYPQ